MEVHYKELQVFSEIQKIQFISNQIPGPVFSDFKFKKLSQATQPSPWTIEYRQQGLIHKCVE